MKKIFFLLIMVLLTGCVTQKPTASQNQNKELVNLPNPASQYCEQQGGRLDIRSDANGNQIGICVFENNSECEEWSYYRGECKPE